VSETWVADLERGLESHSLVTGMLDEALLNQESLRSPSRGPALRPGLHEGFGYLPFASTANLGIRASVFRELGGFNTAFRTAGGEDVDLCWRAQLSGHDLALLPDAQVAYRMPCRLWPSVRQSYRHAAAVPFLYSIYGPDGMPGRSIARTVRSWCWLAANLGLLAQGKAGQGRWCRHLAVNVARISGSARARVLYL
jgi:hypothetical protein